MKRETLLFLLMGQPALLMQIAHPLVARAVAEHSSYSEKPLQRLLTTYRLSMELFTGSEDEARQAAATINRAHKPVRGPDYDARDRVLGQWVWATLVYSVVMGHHLFFNPLSEEEQQTVLDTFRRRGRLLGLSQELPATAGELLDYVNSMIESGEVRVTDEAREVARPIMGELLFPLPAALLPLTTYLARAALPEELRRQYDLSWNPLSQRAFRTLLRPGARLVFPRVSNELRFLS
jgi:uncharacterized protein (DUF2236 family)